ncbi:tetratricopeptide repeat-containing response regulator [Marinobacter sp. SS21]|uniref:tetratricopeptide repeat-containing response regulator n=1 Tax=Marinobacter sp. SS21 TaxID=2979460 RepID=UPI00232D3E5E|nr:tetratricopeptide repeat-containing response regulator [Marinobacter sp. SS21]
MDTAANGHENFFKKLRYLIVDDFDSFRLSMRQMLRNFGAEHIEVANSGGAAIQRCTYEQFDVVLCDYNLGEGKNGQHILEELRHKKLLKRTSLFLMVTAETSKEMVMGAREYQPDAYLTKPINRAMLEKRLGSLVEQRRALLPINRAIDLENFPEAISLCVQALPKQTKYKTWLLKTLADLYQQVGDFGHARKIYDEVLTQRDLSWARLGKGKVLLAEQHFDEAISTLKSLIADHPDYIEGYDLLAQAQAQQGKLSLAQDTLSKAAELSPNALLRQKHFAEIAQTNQDMTTASDAWRKTVQLGAHSIHDNAEHYLGLGRSLCELSEGDSSEAGKAHADEAILVLGRMEKRFPEAPEVVIRSRLIQSRVNMGQGNTAEAEKCLQTVVTDLEEPTSLSADTAIEYAKTLFRLGRAEEAKHLLARLAKQHEDNSELLQQIESLLDEPVSYRQRMVARDLNRTGIKAFEEGALDDAAAAFKQALEIVPSHASLNLNLIQVLMKMYSEQPERQAALKDCDRHLDALAALPEHHRQHRRYLALKKKLEGLKNA